MQRDSQNAFTGREVGLVGYWKLEEKDGPIVRDLSAYATDGTVVGSYIKTLVYAGNVTNASDVFPPLDVWGLTGYNGGATDPYGWDHTKFASRLLADSIIAFESPESLAGEHFKQTFLSRAVSTYGGTRHRITTAEILAENLATNPNRLSAVSVAPDTSSSPPQGSITFTASGGSGTGYVWSLSRNASGGTISAEGVYTAGTTDSSTDVVQVVDSLGNSATRSLTITAGVSVSSGSAAVAPKGSQTFSATGGSNRGYTWSISVNGSGGAIDSGTGRYTAGPLGNVTDVIQVADSLGNSARRGVSVTGGVSITPGDSRVPPRGSMQLEAAGGSGMGTLGRCCQTASVGALRLKGSTRQGQPGMCST